MQHDDVEAKQVENVPQDMVNHPSEVNDRPVAQSTCDPVLSPSAASQATDKVLPQPRSRTASPVLLPGNSPSPRVVKRGSRVTHRRATPADHISPASAPEVPSEEDLLYYLMYRSQQREIEKEQIRALSRAKVQTLEHRYHQVIRERDAIQEALAGSQAAEGEARELHHNVQAEFDNFKARYYKLKNFARSIHGDINALRHSANNQDAIIKELKQADHDRGLVVTQTCSTIQESQSSIGKFKQEIKSIQISNATLLPALGQIRSDLGVKSERLDVELKRNKRLENYILRLQDTQERYNEASKHADQSFTSL